MNNLIIRSKKINNDFKIQSELRFAKKCDLTPLDYKEISYLENNKNRLKMEYINSGFKNEGKVKIENTEYYNKKGFNRSIPYKFKDEYLYNFVYKYPTKIAYIYFNIYSVFNNLKLKSLTL